VPASVSKVKRIVSDLKRRRRSGNGRPSAAGARRGFLSYAFTITQGRMGTFCNRLWIRNRWLEFPCLTRCQPHARDYCRIREG
jgi:hypothetical protein